MYTKNHDPWASFDVMITTDMNNFETIYSEVADHLTSHTHDDSYYTKVEMDAAFWHLGNDGSGSGSDADMIYTLTGNLHAESFYGAGVPTGLIILWHGSVASIPTGWHLCDGLAGTVDLRNRFPVGANSTYSPGATGGGTTFTAEGSLTIVAHALTVAEMPAHSHPFTEYYSVYTNWNWTHVNSSFAEPTGAYGRSGTTSATGGGSAHGHPGSTISLNAVASMPYYYALCYIQKVET